MVTLLENKIYEIERKFEHTNELSKDRLKKALDAETKITEFKTYMPWFCAHCFEFIYPTPYGKLEEKLPKAKANKEVLEHKEDMDTLIKCVEKNLGFSRGKPVAAITIYRCLVYWRSFEAEKTSIFDCFNSMLGSALENQDRNDDMAYWPTNISIFLCLFQWTTKGAQTPPPPATFFARMTRSFRASPFSAKLKVGKDMVYMVDAKYPALLFQQQLIGYMETMYGIIRDNFKRELLPQLTSCIQESKASRGNTSTASPSNHWQSIIESLDGLLDTLKKNYVPSFLVQNIFIQALSFINMHLFNSIVTRQDGCTCRYGEHMKAGLDEFELWCTQIRQSMWALHGMNLNIQGRLWDSWLCMRRKDYLLMISLVTSAPIPFTADDVSLSIQEKDFSNVKPPEELLESQDFQFLLE